MKTFIVACLSSATALGVKFDAYGLGGAEGFGAAGFDMGDVTASVIGQIDSGFEKVGDINEVIEETQIAGIKEERENQVFDILEEASEVDGMVNIFTNIAPKLNDVSANSESAVAAVTKARDNAEAQNNTVL